MVALPTQTLWLLVFLRASADGVELFDRVGLGKPFSREHTTLAFNREPRTSFYTRLSEGFTEVDAPASPVSSPVYSPGASPVYSPVASPVAPVSPKGRTSKGQSSEPKTAKTSTAKTTTAKTTTAKTTTAKTTRTTKDAKGTRTTEKTSKGKEEKCKKDKGSKGGGTGEDGCEEDVTEIPVASSSPSVTPVAVSGRDGEAAAPVWTPSDWSPASPFWNPAWNPAAWPGAAPVVAPAPVAAPAAGRSDTVPTSGVITFPVAPAVPPFAPVGEVPEPESAAPMAASPMTPAPVTPAPVVEVVTDNDEGDTRVDSAGVEIDPSMAPVGNSETQALHPNIVTDETPNGLEYTLELETGTIMLEFGGYGLQLSEIEASMYGRMQNLLEGHFKSAFGPSLFDKFDLSLNFMEDIPTGEVDGFSRRLDGEDEVATTAFVDVKCIVFLKTDHESMLYGVDETFATNLLSTFFAGESLQAFLDDLDDGGFQIQFIRLRTTDQNFADAIATRDFSVDEGTGSATPMILGSLSGVLLLVTATSFLVRRRQGVDDDDSQNLAAGEGDEDQLNPFAPTGSSRDDDSAITKTKSFREKKETTNNPFDSDDDMYSYEDDELGSFMDWSPPGDGQRTITGESSLMGGGESGLYAVDLR